jgi:hypothetical protein
MMTALWTIFIAADPDVHPQASMHKNTVGRLR